MRARALQRPALPAARQQGDSLTAHRIAPAPPRCQDSGLKRQPVPNPRRRRAAAGLTRTEPRARAGAAAWTRASESGPFLLAGSRRVARADSALSAGSCRRAAASATHRPLRAATAPAPRARTEAGEEPRRLPLGPSGQPAGLGPDGSPTRNMAATRPPCRPRTRPRRLVASFDGRGRARGAGGDSRKLLRRAKVGDGRDAAPPCLTPLTDPSTTSGAGGTRHRSPSSRLPRHRTLTNASDKKNVVGTNP